MSYQNRKKMQEQSNDNNDNDFENSDQYEKSSG